MVYWGTRTMSNKYTTRLARSHVAEVNLSCLAIRHLLEGFVNDDRTRAIAMLNKVRPVDVVEHVLGRKLTCEEGTLYLECIDSIPSELQEAFRAGKIWQDLKQAGRKYLQGKSIDSKTCMVAKFRQFLHGLESRTL